MKINNIVRGNVFVDISKCFNTVNHEVLLQKLYKYRVRDTALSWIMFLSK